MRINFTKMQAFGNDYIYINNMDDSLSNLPELARFLTDRHFAIGSDGMVLICSSDKADFRMRIFNPDGSEGEMCGNAIRSVAKYVYDHKLTDKVEFLVETLGGIKTLKVFVDNEEVVNICANIGQPCLDTTVIPVVSGLPEFVEQPVKVDDIELKVSALSWGNPHCVAFIDDVMAFDVHKYGKILENMRELFPNRTNVTFAQIVNDKYIKIREWERGTGETIGCGTGCATAAVIGAITGRCGRDVTVEQIGGNLSIRWDEASNEVFMTSPSYTVFESSIETTPGPGYEESRKHMCGGCA